MRKSEACKLEMKGKVAVHLHPMALYGPDQLATFSTSGAYFARQQVVLLQNEFGKTYAASASHSGARP